MMKRLVTKILFLNFYNYYHIMPKLIDNYVLSRKIGAGQYG